MWATCTAVEDTEKGFYYLKMKDNTLSAAIMYLRERDLFNDDDDEEDVGLLQIPCTPRACPPLAITCTLRACPALVQWPGRYGPPHHRHAHAIDTHIEASFNKLNCIL